MLHYGFAVGITIIPNMLFISRMQQHALGARARQSYLDELRLRFIERSPDLAKTLDDRQITAAVKSSVENAEGWGLTNRGPIRLYFDLCLALGSGFVTDPVYPWAMEALGNGDPVTQSERAEMLYAKSLVAINAVYGPGNSHARDSLERLDRWAREPVDLGGIDAFGAASKMRELHPAKAEHGGEKALRALFESAESICADRGARMPRAIMLAAVLKFAFGSGCFSDPFYPWIGDTVARKNVPDPEDRFERLERKALFWMNVVLHGRKTD